MSDAKIQELLGKRVRVIKNNNIQQCKVGDCGLVIEASRHNSLASAMFKRLYCVIVDFGDSQERVRVQDLEELL